MAEAQRSIWGLPPGSVRPEGLTLSLEQGPPRGQIGQDSLVVWEGPAEYRAVLVAFSRFLGNSSLQSPEAGV